MIRIHLSILIVVLLAAVVSAADDAGQETPFSVGVGARALGMGGGFTSLASDASAVFYNPAGLPRLLSQEMTVMHMDLYYGTIYNYVGWAYPDLTLGGIGLAFMRIGTDDIIRRSNYIDIGRFDYSHWQLMLSYGRNLQQGISVGASFKIVNQSLGELSDYGFGFDIGMMGRLYRSLHAGLAIRDMVPPELQLESTSEIAPITVAVGVGMREQVLSRRLLLSGSLEVEKIENRKVLWHSGAELTVDSSYALRVGFDKDNLAFGAGLKYGRFVIDYAYKIQERIENSHRFSLSMMIGTSIPDQLERQRQRERMIGTEMLEDERRRQFEFYRDKANDYYSGFRLDSALVYYQRALAFDLDNEEIVGTIAAIENAIQFQQEEQRRIQDRQRELNQAIVNYMTQARNFYEKKYFRAAQDMLGLVFDISPNHPEALQLLAQVNDAITSEVALDLEVAGAAEAEGNYVRALESYNRVLELDPGNVSAEAGKARVATHLDHAQQLNRGVEQFNAGNYGSAKRTFSTVLSLDPNNVVALDYLKRIAMLEEKSTTLEDLQKDIRVWQFYLDGLRYMRNKEYQKAIESWNKVLQVYPNNINTLDNIEQARLRLKSEQPE